MRHRTLLVFFLLIPALATASVEEGDALWEKRADGARGARAAESPIDAAIGAYQQALAADPRNLEARWKLLRALRFKGAYVLQAPQRKREIFELAKTIGGEGIVIVEKELRARKLSLEKSPEEETAAAIRSIPHSPELLYWDAVSWGEWALVFGKLAAARQGVAERIRRQSTLVMLADSSVERGGGARVLGRLHNQTPTIPFLTGWASDREAVRYLREALTHDPDDKLTKVFLAEAIKDADGAFRPAAVRLLHEVLDAPLDQEWPVEEAAAQDDARALLAKWR